MNKHYDQLFEAIDEIINAGGTWQEKRDDILAYTNEDMRTNLFEFLGWFEEVDE